MLQIDTVQESVMLAFILLLITVLLVLILMVSPQR